MESAAVAEGKEAHELVYTMPFEEEELRAEHVREWLRTQPSWHVVRVVHRRRTLGWLDRDAARGAVCLLTRPTPAVSPLPPGAEGRWPWTRAVREAALGPSRLFPDVERDVQACLAQLTGRLEPAQFTERAARGVWVLLLAEAVGEAPLGDEWPRALRSWTAARLEAAVEDGAMHAWWADAPEKRAPPRPVSLAEARVREGALRDVFPWEGTFAALPWETVATSPAAGGHWTSRRLVLVRGEAWLPARLAWRWGLQELAQRVWTGARVELPRACAGWTRHPASRLLLRSAHAALRRWLAPAPAATPRPGGVDVLLWPPCLRRAWFRPRHMRHTERTAVWCSLLAVGVSAEELRQHTAAHMKAYYPRAAPAERQAYLREYVRDIQRWAQKVGAVKEPPEAWCRRRRAEGWSSGIECERCDRACGDRARVAVTPSQRARLAIVYEADDSVWGVLSRELLQEQ